MWRSAPSRSPAVVVAIGLEGHHPGMGPGWNLESHARPTDVRRPLWPTQTLLLHSRAPQLSERTERAFLTKQPQLFTISLKKHLTRCYQSEFHRPWPHFVTLRSDSQTPSPAAGPRCRAANCRCDAARHPGPTLWLLSPSGSCHPLVLVTLRFLSPSGS